MHLQLLQGEGIQDLPKQLADPLGGQRLAIGNGGLNAEFLPQIFLNVGVLKLPKLA